MILKYVVSHFVDVVDAVECLLAQFLLKLGGRLQTKAQVLMDLLNFVVRVLALMLLRGVGSLVVLRFYSHGLRRLDRHGRKVLLGWPLRFVEFLDRQLSVEVVEIALGLLGCCL